MNDFSFPDFVLVFIVLYPAFFKLAAAFFIFASDPSMEIAKGRFCSFPNTITTFAKVGTTGFAWILKYLQYLLPYP